MPPPHLDHHHHHHHEEMEDYDDYDWEELPPHLKDAAKVLGWDQKLWDEDGKADTEDLDWHDLTHEQRKAAEQFGYHPKLWDDGHGHRHPPPPHHDHHHHEHHKHHEHHTPPKKEEEKKDGDEDEEGQDAPDVGKLDISDADAEEAYEDKEETTDDGNKKEDSQKKKQAMFKLSKSYGGGGGDKFDHGTNRHISKITVYSDGHVVHGLEVGYANATKKDGQCGGKPTTFTLERGEFITSVTVRSNKFVQSIGFKTNKGNMLGPVGGKGWTKIDPRGNDTEGEEVKVVAPFKYQLCGLTGRAGKLIDQIAFRWGPVPQQGGNNQKKQSK